MAVFARSPIVDQLRAEFTFFPSRVRFHLKASLLCFTKYSVAASYNSFSVCCWNLCVCILWYTMNGIISSFFGHISQEPAGEKSTYIHCFQFQFCLLKTRALLYLFTVQMPYDDIICERFVLTYIVLWHLISFSLFVFFDFGLSSVSMPIFCAIRNIVTRNLIRFSCLFSLFSQSKR